jgi:NodT family efflux transporter outer membrane factor (OMF) lipoprotein
VRRTTPLLIAAAALLPGCGLLSKAGLTTMVGPEYAEPETAAAERWIDYADGRVKSAPADLSSWWKVLGDPGLDRIMEKALEGNLSLRGAVERVAAARARRDLAAGYEYPQVQGAAGGASRTRLSEDAAAAVPGGDRTVTSYDAGVGAVWELDLWGRYARAVEAADAELEASLAGHDAVQVLLCAEVASRYVAYRTFQERIGFVKENIAVQEGAFQIAQDRFTAGAVSERDVHEARQVLEQTRARLPGLEAGLRTQAIALCILSGVPPRDLAAELGEGRVPAVPASVVIGIPADLVRRRPDVRRAERLAAARCALIGIAEADYYPSFSISGSAGVSAEKASDLFSADALTSVIGARFTWSLLDWGRTAANVRIHEAEFREATLAYQESVLRAGGEVEDAVIRFLKATETLVPQGAAVEAAGRTVAISREQYNQGAVAFSTVFLFTGVLTQQQDVLAEIRGSAALALVDLYRALGGGWTPPPPAPVAGE